MSFQLWTRKFLRRLRIGQFLQVAAEWLAIFLLSYGSLVLLVKLAFPALWPHVLWIGLGAFPLAFLAWKVVSRESFTETESVAYLDRKLNTGGLLMTLSESPDEEWQSRLPQAQLLWQNSLPRFRPVRFAKLVLVPLLFCVACGFVPLREVAITEPLDNKSTTEKNVADLKEQFEKLKQEQVIEKEEAERIERELEQLLEQKKDPLTHEKWEMVDALWQKMQLRVEQKAVLVSKAHQAASALAKAKQGGGEPLTPEQIQQLTEQIEAGMNALNGSQNRAGEGKPGQTSGKLGQMLKDGKLNLPSDPAERERMLSELRDLLESEEKKLCEMRGECKNGQCRGTSYSLEDLLSNCELPGRGGVTRGRGDASLNYGHETDEQGAKFKETVLPKGFQDNPGDEIVSTTLAPPKEEVADAAPRGPERLSDPSTGQATWNRKISPKHRAVVKGYFDKP